MVTKKPLFAWVKESNVKLQLLLLAVIGVTVAARVFPLEMQKKIINEAISLKQVELLVLYSGLYLASVLLASGLKYVITLLQTSIGERALQKMRQQLFEHILTLPLSFFRKTSAGTVIASLVQELTAAGEFVGAAIAIPVTNILTLVSFAAYMFYLSPTMAAISLALYPVLIFLLPPLQRRTNNWNKARVESTRVLSNKISESIGGIHEIHGNGSFHIESRKYFRYLQDLYRIRITWTLYRQGVKVLNNLFQSTGPFLLFLVGGWLAINGRFDLGALVAFLSAYEKIYDPWKELMDFYQVYQDAKIRYAKTMEAFDVEPEFILQPADARAKQDLAGAIEIKNLVFEVEGGIRLLNGIDMSLANGEHLALVGFSGSGKSTLAQCMGQLYKYTGGSVQIDGREVADLPKSDVAHNMGYVAQAPFIFDGTIQENLLYGVEADLPLEAPRDAQGRITDPALLPSLDRMIEVVQQTGIFQDVLRFGLNTILAPEQGAQAELRNKIIAIRQDFRNDHGPELADHLEFFEEGRYLEHSSVAANLIFGHPVKPEYAVENLAKSSFFTKFLGDAQLRLPLLTLGDELARQTVDILGELPEDALFFEQSPILPEELERWKEYVARGRVTLAQLPREEQDQLLEVALRFTPGRHKMAPFSRLLEALVLEGRSRFRAALEAHDPGAVSFYRADGYIDSQPILDNILFGKAKTDQPHVMERIQQAIVMLLIEQDMLEAVVAIGMQFRVGTKGDRLSGGQKQKLAIARAFMKEPPILIMDEATSALDNRSQSRIQNLIETKWKGRSTLVAVVHRLDIIKNFDQVAVMKAGKIVEQGSYADLMAKKGSLYELVHGAQQH
ncbi:ABC transporter ATP-binding protein/permease [Megalodesulfovibrio gigas]|uniref:Putative ABC transporter-like protein n=1 Tax=Megalodesulfovibrio gigas (strain ATCC 19364 / DSM 1382 / NCIMB 9332 / VKM B-1759) TaxID=1121448 RepID=T2GAY8_MEGG1|nr:ABC transporter ATP-binding protein/permease [Megalodesulfovibrio gigas]AGW13052.1 putative ABC transporter-like protein [Megalodesulfovibrio gigas DSM 1382 = ATCC 19364]